MNNIPDIIRQTMTDEIHFIIKIHGCTDLPKDEDEYTIDGKSNRSPCKHPRVIGPSTKKLNRWMDERGMTWV